MSRFWIMYYIFCQGQNSVYLTDCWTEEDWTHVHRKPVGTYIHTYIGSTYYFRFQNKYVFFHSPPSVSVFISLSQSMYHKKHRLDPRVRSFTDNSPKCSSKRMKLWIDTQLVALIHHLLHGRYLKWKHNVPVPYLHITLLLNRRIMYCHVRAAVFSYTTLYFVLFGNIFVSTYTYLLIKISPTNNDMPEGV